MTEDHQVIALTVENQRLAQENDLLRAENAILRPRVYDLERRLHAAERHRSIDLHPHDVPPTGSHD